MTPERIALVTYCSLMSDAELALSRAWFKATATAIREAIAAEREACAKVAEGFIEPSDSKRFSTGRLWRSSNASRIASAIRARVMTASAPTAPREENPPATVGNSGRDSNSAPAPDAAGGGTR